MKHARVFVLAAAAFFLLPEPAEAFRVMRTPNGSEVHWPSNRIPVSYRLHSAGSVDVTDGSDLTALVASFQTWEAVGCSSIRFQRGPDFTGTPRFSCSDNMNLLFWIESNWPPDAGREALGVTTACYNPNNGALVDADIWFNGVHFGWATDGRRDRVDVRNIATHEVGHFFGLDHSEFPDATMYYASAGAGETIRRTLHQDDVAGICHMYPTGCVTDGDCPGDYVCVRGSCEPPPADPSGLGEPCSSDQECEAGTGSSNAMCVDEATFSFPGGYCTVLDCGQASPCPSGGECIAAFVDSDNNTIHACFTSCNPSSPSCRDGYVCLGLQNDPSRGACYPACQSDADCGPNYCDRLTGYCVAHRNDTARIGDGCTEHTQCPTGGGCLVEHTSLDPSYVGPPGGYCTKECGPGLPCPSGSSCYTLEGDEGPMALCLRDCRPGQQSDCRSGYACWPSGQTEPTTGAQMGACWLACESDVHCSGDGSLVCNQETGLCEPATSSGGDPGVEPGDGDSPGDPGGDPGDGGVPPQEPGGGGGAADPFVGCPGCGAAGGGGGLLALFGLLAFYLTGSRFHKRSVAQPEAMSAA